MLKAEDIMTLKLERARLRAHEDMPSPAYVRKALTGQFTAIGEAAIGSLLGVEPSVFEMQLDAARSFGASYLTEGTNPGEIVGVTATTSLIHRGDILHKNVILPRDLMHRHEQLAAHYLVGVFVRGEVVDDRLQDVENVEVAGWLRADELGRIRSPDQPPTFRSRLPVIMVPCANLQPVDTLVTELVPQGGCV